MVTSSPVECKHDHLFLTITLLFLIQEATTVFNNPVCSSTSSTTGSANVLKSIAARIEKPVTGLLLTLGLAAVAMPPLSASNSVPLDISKNVSPKVTLAAQVAPASSAQPLANGVYLYGQAPQRDQVNSAYLVFEVTDGQIIGAFYMPRSSFDCVYGDMQADQLALNVVDSYSREAYPYAVALESSGAIADASQGTAAPVTLEGMHRIENINSNDQRILSTCKADHLPQ